MTKTKKRVCEITFNREKGIQTLYIKTIKDIEGLFKSKSIERSEKYVNNKGEFLKYYKELDVLRQYTSSYTEHTINISRYGTSLILDDYNYNASILRTVGISSGVTIVVDGLITDNKVQTYIKVLAEYIKYLYQNFISKSEVKAVINLEL